MKTADINPHIRYADNHILSPASFFTRSYDCRLLYLQQGQMIFHFGDLSYKIDEETLLVWQPIQKYRFEKLCELKVILLNFDFTQDYSEQENSISVIKEDLFEPSLVHAFCDFDDCPELSSLAICRNMCYVESDLQIIVREMHERKKYFREVSSSILKRILCDIIRGTIADNMSGMTVERVISFIRENYSRQISNKAISDSVNYHEFYVNKLIQKQTGMTLHRYLTNYRVQNAAKLLVTTEYPVSKISELCGFTSSAYFISAFRQQLGEPPNEYRKRRNGLF